MVVIIMGVSGSGKSTVGAMLARRFCARFIEGDDYHSSANIEKMSSGVPLDDSDRMPWLAALASEIRRHRAGGSDVVVACSALKARYRELLVGDIPDSFFVYLKGDEPLIRQRIDKRPGHCMPENLLVSQFEILEEPPEAIVIDIQDSPERIVGSIHRQLRNSTGR